jgi:hypothetical protein
MSTEEDDDRSRPPYAGLPAAANVEQAIVLAQRLILRDLERRARRLSETPDLEGDSRRAA